MKFFAVFKKPKGYVPFIVVLLVLTGIALSRKGSSAKDVTFTVAKRDIAQTVSVTGRVKSASDVALAFEKSGRVKHVYHPVGDSVYPGEALVSLENADLYASVKAAQAKLAQLENGSTPAEVRVAEVQVQNAQTALDDARQGAADALVTASTNMDDVLHNKVDAFFSNPRSISPQFNPQTDSQLRSNVESSRVGLDAVLVTWSSRVTKLPGDLSQADFVSLFAEAKKNVNAIRTLVDYEAQAINGLSSGTNLTQTTIDSYKATMLSARTTVLAQLSAITAVDQALRSAQSALDLKESQYEVTNADARPEAILAQEAEVEQAQALLEKTILRSPIYGVVTAKNVEEGEIVAANSAAVSVMSQDKYKIEANVAESDIANIRTKNKADVTLDAYPEVHFEAEVVTVDPAEVIIEGVSTYKVTLHFVKADERIRSGMTANTDIVTAEAKGALLVPLRALSMKDGKRFVKVLAPRAEKGAASASAPTETLVTVGIKDGEGNIQILSGVSEGDTVVVTSGK